MILYHEGMYLIRDRFKDQRWVRFMEQETRRQVLFIQARPDGQCPKMTEALLSAFWPDLVVSCYPTSAQALYPDLVFLGAGDWDGEVVIDWFPHFCRVSAKENDGDR